MNDAVHALCMLIQLLYGNLVYSEIFSGTTERVRINEVLLYLNTTFQCVYTHNNENQSHADRNANVPVFGKELLQLVEAFLREEEFPQEVERP